MFEVGRHHRGDVKYNLCDSVPPGIGIFPVRLTSQPLGVECGAVQFDSGA